MIQEILIYSLESAMIFSLLFIPYLFIKNDTFFYEESYLSLNFYGDFFGFSID